MLHKIYISALVVVLGLGVFVGYQWLKAHDAWKDFQKDLAVSQTLEKQNKKDEVKATGAITTAQASNVSIDNETKRKLASIDERTAKQLNSDDVKAILKEEMPKLDIQKTKDASGNDVLAVLDNQANRDILNHADGAYKTCKFSLDDCQQKQANDKTIIDQQTVIIALKQATIDQNEKDLKKATSFGKGGNIWSRTGRVGLPVGCAALAAWGARKANADAKTTFIASGASGAVCAFKF